jgi:hypothetical protein
LAHPNTQKKSARNVKYDLKGKIQTRRKRRRGGTRGEQ